jgi:hypothetical protein
MRVRQLGRRLLTAALLLGAVSGTAAAADLADLVGAYLKAGKEQTPGVVAARAYQEGARPTAPPTPQPDISVALLPYSAALEADLDAVKAGLRDSVDAYTRAPGRVETVRVDHERALVAAGGGSLVRHEITDAQGSARFGDLPAGRWLLLAWRESGHVGKKLKVNEKDARRYPDVPTNVTYSVVTYWKSRVTVGPAETVEVPITDRNAWMTAGRQESRPPGPPKEDPTGKSKPSR